MVDILMNTKLECPHCEKEIEKKEKLNLSFTITVKCPHCEKGMNVELDNLFKSSPEHACSSCGKNFNYSEEILEAILDAYIEMRKNEGFLPFLNLLNKAADLRESESQAD